MSCVLSIIIPVLNDAVALERLCTALTPVKNAQWEIIVVDGGSIDDSVSVAASFAHQVISATPGRARQMQAGADVASGDVLWFVHADSGIPLNLLSEILLHARQHSWGRCDVTLDGAHPMFRIIEWFMNHRARFTGICTGDQGIFVRRDVLLNIGGFADIPLMEDIDLSERLKKIAAPFVPQSRIIASSRRWNEHGIARTIFLMWYIRLRFFLGATPESLHSVYYRKSH
ncbi:MAG: TIGR04283 family arsenosugar biosynthesis glycosyltransferase [Alcanivoracaceae bacterium]|nr:TIGR04283 family arsenosugar biosynthesis glycosyltransferase [Alcanivoracaceae bacterium]